MPVLDAGAVEHFESVAIGTMQCKVCDLRKESIVEQAPWVGLFRGRREKWITFLAGCAADSKTRIKRPASRLCLASSVNFLSRNGPERTTRSPPPPKVLTRESGVSLEGPFREAIVGIRVTELC